MPDQAAYPLASMLVPFGVARDTLAQVDERIGALGAGLGEMVDALALRMNTLPASAVFQPFANAPQGGLAGALQGVMPAGKPKRNGLARQARRAAASAAVQGTHTTVAGPLSFSRMPGRGPAAVAQAEALQKIMRSIGGSRSQPDALGRKADPVRAAARAAQQAAQDQAAVNPFWLPLSGQLAADLVGQLLKTVAPAAQALGQVPGAGGLAAWAKPQGMLGQAGLGQVVQQALAGALGAGVPPQRRARSRSPRSTAQVLGGTAVGVLDSVHWSGILSALLDAIAKDPPAARQATRGQARRTTSLPAAAAPRAPTRLLPSAAGASPEGATGGTPRPAAPAVTDDGNSALDELHRSLLDQAWLRGVDLR